MHNKHNKKSHNGNYYNAGNPGKRAEKGSNDKQVLVWPLAKAVFAHGVTKKDGTAIKSANEISLLLSKRITPPPGLERSARRVKKGKNTRPFNAVMQVLQANYEIDWPFGPSWDQIRDEVKEYIIPDSFTVEDPVFTSTVDMGQTTIFPELEKIDVQSEVENFKSEIFILLHPIQAIKKRANELSMQIQDPAERAQFGAACLQAHQAFVHAITRKLPR